MVQMTLHSVFGTIFKLFGTESQEFIPNIYLQGMKCIGVMGEERTST